MTKVRGDFLLMEPEPDKECELCGKIAECRPYGPNNEQICFECGEKMPEIVEIVEKQFLKRLNGEGIFGSPELEDK
jgi:hypothetical protein